VSLASLERSVPPGERILLDTTTLIAYLNRGEQVSPIARHIVEEWVEVGRNGAIVSMVTVMEVLVRPLCIGLRFIAPARPDLFALAPRVGRAAGRTGVPSDVGVGRRVFGGGDARRSPG
jgi:hypothetical protein